MKHESRHLRPRPSYGASAMCCFVLPLRGGSASGRGRCSFCFWQVRSNSNGRLQFSLACSPGTLKAVVAFNLPLSGIRHSQPQNGGHDDDEWWWKTARCQERESAQGDRCIAATGRSEGERSTGDQARQVTRDRSCGRKMRRDRRTISCFSNLKGRRMQEAFAVFFSCVGDTEVSPTGPLPFSGVAPGRQSRPSRGFHL